MPVACIWNPMRIGSEVCACAKRAASGRVAAPAARLPAPSVFKAARRVMRGAAGRMSLVMVRGIPVAGWGSGFLVL